MKKIEVPWAKENNYYKKIWLEIFDGGSGQWLYVVSNGMCFIFIDIIDLVEYGGKEMGVLFAASVKVVDLLNMNPNQLGSAIVSCGMQHDNLDITKADDRLRIAEACVSYGAAAPMWSDEGGKLTKRFEYGGYDEKHPAFRKLRSDARKYAETLFDDEERQEQMDTKIVNAIGSTATEYMNDDLWNVLRRAKENPTPEQELILKIFYKCETTLGGEKIPEDLRG